MHDGLAVLHQVILYFSLMLMPQTYAISQLSCCRRCVCVRHALPWSVYSSYVGLTAGLNSFHSIASGLLYVSELIEEHSRLAKVVGQRGIYVRVLQSLTP